MTKPAKRQHYLARFYLRNFTDPMFSDNLHFYDKQNRLWEQRTPHGVGWFPHLLTMIDNTGKRTDEFDQFLKLHVEDPAAPALKKMATAEAVSGDERFAIAMFIALTAARLPAMAKRTTTEYLQQLTGGERKEMETLTKIWSAMTGRQHTSDSIIDFYKPSNLGAMWIWAKSFQHRLLRWQWHTLRTTEDQPFICSDWPVFAEWDQADDLRLVSFPVSSTVALIIISAGQINRSHSDLENVRAINRHTMHRAREFIVACREEFPGNKHLDN